MKNFYLLFALGVFAGCTKDEAPLLECERSEVALVDLICKSNYQYEVTLDGAWLATFYGKSELIDVEVPQGYHTLTATQQSGYILYPTIVTKNYNLESCKTFSFTFP